MSSNYEISSLFSLSFLIHAQVQELTKLWKKLVEGRNTAFILQKNLRDLLSQDDFAACQGQSHHEKLMAWRELAERLARDLCPGDVAPGPCQTWASLRCPALGEPTRKAVSASLPYCLPFPGSFSSSDATLEDRAETHGVEAM